MRLRAAFLVTAVLVAGAVHGLAAHYLADRDPFVALRVRHGWQLALAGAGLMGARLFLLFVAPGWALHRGVMALWARRQARGARTSS